MNQQQRDIYYPVLFLISLGLVLWQYLGMERHLNYSLNEESPISLSTQLADGRVGKGLLLRQQNKATLFCNISNSQQPDACALQLKLVENNQAGITLANFENIQLNLSFQSTAPDSIWLQVFTQHNAKHLHLYQQSILPKQGRASYSIDVDSLYQPSWWQFAQGENQHSQQDARITYISLLTGDNTLDKNIELSLHSVQFSGKWLQAKDLYLALLGIWLVSITYAFFSVTRGVKEQHQQSNKHALELNKINSYLSIERDNYEFMAKTDPLTSCFNRAGLSSIFGDIIIEYAEIGMPASIVLFDIDHFKKINDQYGHDEGDKVLVNLANLVRQQIREGDYLARWGGEEFLVVCTHTRLKGACALAEHLRQSIENTILSEETRITSSFGVAEINSGFLEQWIKRADEALYQAKEGGRNKVVAAS
ncbi:GGDEF domain-containing protein [Agarivorans sp. OAG1]|uniref:GGDEF domain-containing protein n=1 Tax=unclassified Agarivorans TaxID=2636026 RepID=UPI00128C0566|nr:GGDEF domain-containing protein [Agarivorans sp. B2Z047]MPW31243.1 diguanylate cyclase [Agarivorans sp. B2Z047]UQN42791.1 GGDEF domain-containing protein [Agarivorans sp. B2Z047]BEU05299.1 GGDEF domain-containing protein [Agarivorans sp. OAG1]